MGKKYYKQKQTANADSVNNLMRRWNIPECPIFAKEQYIKRHNTVCAQLHFSICKEIRVKLDKKKHRYDHVPNSVETSHEAKVTILWNNQVRTTDRTIPNNKPDVIIRGNKQGTCTGIDVATLETECAQERS